MALDVTAALNQSNYPTAELGFLYICIVLAEEKMMYKAQHTLKFQGHHLWMKA